MMFLVRNENIVHRRSSDFRIILILDNAILYVLDYMSLRHKNNLRTTEQHGSYGRGPGYAYSFDVLLTPYFNVISSK